MSHLQPKKRFGQHFLHDRGIVQRILDAFDPQPGETLVEIGPGPGALTRPLLARHTPLHVVELDRDLAAHLRADFPPEQLVVHEADALKFDFCALAPHTDVQVSRDDSMDAGGTSPGMGEVDRAGSWRSRAMPGAVAETGSRERPPPGGTLRLIGNLPYNISTPLLFHLLDQSACIQDMLFMLQKEVVDRMAAAPGGKDYGRLSVMIQWRLRVEKLFDVRPGAFTPPPKVDSSVVRLVPHATPPIQVRDVDDFARVVRAAFAQRRKTLRNNLKGLISGDRLAALGIDPQRRAETLTLTEFAALANALPPLA
jgi:16S rRNA (adenine1518-N6/adenine1519-N6)-dimethyltransferase